MSHWTSLKFGHVKHKYFSQIDRYRSVELEIKDVE